MTLFVLLRTYTAAFFRKFGWLGLGMVIGLHAVVAYLGLWLFEERHLLSPETFLYFYVTTTATVGYGDLSPQTAGGRLFVAGWVMLGGIALITAGIGKATNSVLDLWRRKMKGRGDFSSRKGHTVLVGWQGEDSERIVNLLRQDSSSNDDHIVVCDSRLDENPLPDAVAFIKGESLTSAALLRRAGLAGAERVLVMTASDDETLAIVLTINQLGPVGHVVAHFGSSEKAALARTYAPALECTSNMAIEMLVRSSQDPGSSVVINELLCVGEGATQYQMKLPDGFASRFGDLFLALKQDHNATLIGYRGCGAGQVAINPDNDHELRGGEIFYIASKRLAEGVLA